MQASDFTEDSPGRLVPTVGGHRAFVPGDLPPDIRWTGELIGAVWAAERALGRLGGLGEQMPNPYLLMRPFVRREAVLSSRIEGTQASIPQLLLFEVNEKVERSVPDVRETANYVRALEYGLRRGKQLPLCLRLIRDLHRILLKGVRGEDRLPGRFRTTQVHIGPADSPLDQAVFVPPPPGSELIAALGRLEEYLHAPSDLPPVVRLALVHYQFEAIHPFVDGNGRIGRLLISLMLCLEGILPAPLLYLSAYFHRTRQEYYDRLLQVSLRGAWNDWLAYFARGVAQEGQDAVDRARRLTKMKTQYLRKVSAARVSALLPRLVEELFNSPIVTVTNVARLLKVTYATAQKHVDRLVESGILREVTGQKRGRIYAAEKIIRSIYEPDYRRADLKLGRG